ncbi:glycosyltransferase 61 family protein [Aliiroseovarius crassostreae]|uniref:glycosyltransferase 61 family protein n=1 Tax=Aliiroseovarius crassostreae TaxID=154981 RepID=UPI003C7A4AD2
MSQRLATDQLETLKAQNVLSTFQDVTIVPTQRFHQRIHCGGPIWPDFENRHFERQCRKGAPVDTCPTAPDTVQLRREEGVWGGFLDRQFGHLVAEHLSRLPIAKSAWPEKRFFFTIEPGLAVSDIPNYVWDLLAWFGVEQDAVDIVTQPIRVETLHACAQGETLPAETPVDGYLDLLETITSQQGLKPDPHQITYVSREGQLAKGGGGHLGEDYLIKCLVDLGVHVLDPARVTPKQQMQTYAGSKTLIFAEGSALHGRQLLGRLDQDIHVLRRRKNRWMAQRVLAPRVAKLEYHDTADSELAFYRKDGHKKVDCTAALYNVPVLLDLFEDLGVPLRSVWDQAAYENTVAAEALNWLQQHNLQPEHMLENLDRLSGAGITIMEKTSTPSSPFAATGTH